MNKMKIKSLLTAHENDGCFINSSGEVDLSVIDSGGGGVGKQLLPGEDWMCKRNNFFSPENVFHYRPEPIRGVSLLSIREHDNRCFNVNNFIQTGH